MNTEIDDERLQEWRELQELVRIAGNLDGGSGITGKISHLERIHDRITCTDYRTPRASFIDWLNQVLSEKYQQRQEP